MKVLHRHSDAQTKCHRHSLLSATTHNLKKGSSSYKRTLNWSTETATRRYHWHKWLRDRLKTQNTDYKSLRPCKRPTLNPHERLSRTNSLVRRMLCLLIHVMPQYHPRSGGPRRRGKRSGAQEKEKNYDCPSKTRQGGTDCVLRGRRWTWA